MPSVSQAGVNSLTTWSKIARFLIGAFLIALIPVIISYAVILSFDINYGLADLSFYGISALALALAYFLFVVAAIPILVWVYRAHANLHTAKLEELKYSPAWASIGFLVPLANLYFPFVTMRELHNRSQGVDPIHADAEVSSVTSWWACHIGAMVVLLFTTLTWAFNNLLPGIWLTTPPAADTTLNILGHLLLAGSAFFLFKTIGAVTDAQAQGMTAASVFE